MDPQVLRMTTVCLQLKLIFIKNCKKFLASLLEMKFANQVARFIESSLELVTKSLQHFILFFSQCLFSFSSFQFRFFAFLFLFRVYILILFWLIFALLSQRSIFNRRKKIGTNTPIQCRKTKIIETGKNFNAGLCKFLQFLVYVLNFLG